MRLIRTKAQCATIPATNPPIVWARMAFEMSFLYPNESNIAVCVERNPLQHIPIAVQTAIAFPSINPSAANFGIRLKAAPTAPSEVIGLICNILLLGTFKYAGFFATTLNSIGIPVSIPKISLPIGISFYTFQSISYLIDVYRREAPAQRRFQDLLLYISMFPQLIAGPIVRYDIVALEIRGRKVRQYDIVEGCYRFLIGLGKKVILANQFSEIADQFLANGLQNLSTFGAWVGILAFTLQIFFDFSGYSDMAIGLGRCLGFHFAENFKHPYCCTSISDFWRKWHMSLYPEKSKKI